MDSRDSRREIFPSRRLLALLRAVVSVACLAVELTSQKSHWAVTGMAFLFTLYSVVALLSRWERRPGLEFLGTLIQTIFFLVFAAFGRGAGTMVASAVYIHLIFSSVILHRPWDTGIVGAACAVFLALIKTDRTVALLPLVVWAGLLGVVAAAHKNRRDKILEEYSRQAKECRAEAERARNEERHKLAGDFHDGPLQAFSGLQMRLEVLRKILERKPEAAAEELRSIRELTRSQTAEMRAFLRGIRPVQVGEGGLASSLRQLAADFQKHSGVTTTFQSQGSLEGISEEGSLELVQIVREALTNIQKHSKATRAAVTIREGHNQVEISIEDNGAGFPFSGAYNLDELELLRIGPLSIQRRVRSLGGKLVVESRPQRGASLAVQIPV